MNTRKSLRADALRLAACTFSLVATGTAQAESLMLALAKGAPSGELRLRHETAVQDDFVHDAQATTLRGALGYITPRWHGFDVGGEVEGVIALNSNHYNSTGNGVRARPIVPDPEVLDLNQAWVRYQYGQGYRLTVGRQRIVLDNARFIGDLAFRQDNQSFDAVMAEAPIGPATLKAGFINRVQSFRRFGANGVATCAVSGPCSKDLDVDGSLLNLQYAPSPALKLTAYGYWLDFEHNTAARRDTQSLGLRATGVKPIAGSLSLTYAIEASEQTGIAQSPEGLGASYRLAELGLSQGATAAKLGYERLGGDGRYGFQTPLASLHPFQGWADLFLATPVKGVNDAYAQVNGEAYKTKWIVAYHRFEADSDNTHYGNEWNAQVIYPLSPRASVGVKAANYDAKGYPLVAGQPVDVAKGWAWVQIKL